MELRQELKQLIEHVADEVLTQLERIAAAAKGKLHDRWTLGSDASASIYTITSSSAIQKLDQISQANRASYQLLAAEPAFARVAAIASLRVHFGQDWQSLGSQQVVTE